MRTKQLHYSSSSRIDASGAPASPWYVQFFWGKGMENYRDESGDNDWPVLILGAGAAGDDGGGDGESYDGTFCTLSLF